MANALRYKHTNIPREKGELARFKVIQGPDYGTTYVLIARKALIGRGEENDIVISDLKASRVHAEISLTSTGWVIKDKGSANGILLNGVTSREGRLKISDTITLGETTLEFITSDAGTQMLVAPPKTMEQVQAQQKMMAGRLGKIKDAGLGNLFGSIKSGAPGQSSTGQDLLKDKRVLLIGGVGLLAFLMFGDNQQPAKAPPKKQGSDSKQDLASYLPSIDSNKTADALFKDGLREYFLGNYNRARVQFETVLQISPGHSLANLYLENCDHAVKEEVKVHLEYGKKSFQAGKLHDAKAHYERVLRLLHKDQSNPAYIESKEQLDQVLKVMSQEEGSS